MTDVAGTNSDAATTGTPGGESGGSHAVVALRTTGLVPEVVAENTERIISERWADGWRLERVEPIVYNSSTTGYLLLIFINTAVEAPRR